MAKHKIFSVLMLIVLTSSLSLAQEKPKAEELLRYFPEGIYSFISHSERSSDGNEETINEAWSQHPVYLRFKDEFAELRKSSPPQPRMPKMFSSVLSEHILSTTTARITSVTVKKVKVPVSAEDLKDQRALAKRLIEQYPGASILRGGRLKNGMVELVIRQDFGDTFVVRQMDDAVRAIEEALAIGEITTTERHIRKLPVYEYKSPAFRMMGKKSAFIYATDFNEVLVAGRIEGLEKMVATSEGETPSLLENEIYSGLPDVISDLPERWNISLLRASTLERRKELELRNVPEEELLSFDESEESGPLYQLSKREIDIAGLKEIEITIFASEEDAKKAFESKQTSSPFSNQPATGYNYLQIIEALKLEKSTWKIDGNTITKITIQDEEYYRRLIECTKEYQKFMKEFAPKQSAGK